MRSTGLQLVWKKVKNMKVFKSHYFATTIHEYTLVIFNIFKHLVTFLHFLISVTDCVDSGSPAPNGVRALSYSLEGTVILVPTWCDSNMNNGGWMVRLIQIFNGFRFQESFKFWLFGRL